MPNNGEFNTREEAEIESIKYKSPDWIFDNSN
jgi:hypothetical protein